MILVTVGTTPFSFERMVNVVNKLSLAYSREKILFQHGSTPLNKLQRRKNIYTFKELPFNKLQDAIKEARIIISHAGPATLFQIWSKGKKPYVLPRLQKWGEHVNNHQQYFCSFLMKHKKVFLIKDQQMRYALSQRTYRTKGEEPENLVRELNKIAEAIG